MSLKSYVFDKFTVNGVDNVSNPLTVAIVDNVNVKAHYREENQTGTQLLKGEVSKQAATGETVTITVTKPDTTTEVVTALTDAMKAYSVSYSGTPGNYSAVAVIGEDAENFGATSDPFLFTLTKDARTITLHG
jgi:hypothetical protein